MSSVIKNQPSADGNADENPSFHRRVLPAILQVVVGLGGTAILSHMIDDGTVRTWPRLQQGLTSVSVFVLLAIGIRPILRHDGGDERFAWLVIIVPFWVALTFFIGLGLQRLTSLSVWSTFIGIHALVVAYGVWQRPWWFWEDARAKALSGLIGDTAARLVYAAVVIVMLVYAVMIGKLDPRVH